ncbi:FHA domain-containing protein [Kribbella sp. NPDC050241]|uniref:FHA domain-containing protein n=1 Tax=Kribbella sp. NPDC050241 TaxID=3364115 RepID=UPI00379A139F
MGPSTAGATYLVVESAGSDQGRRISLVGNRLTVGRLPSCDVRFDDIQVSRTHAALWRQGGLDYVEDLGSSGGTYVNDVPIGAPRQLSAGDTVAFAGLRLRYEGDRTPAPQQAVRYDIGDQRAESINNVGRDQYNYSQQVIQQRESFFREIAATRTRARWMVWMGVVLFVAGLGIAYAGGYSFFKLIIDTPMDSTGPPDNFGDGFLTTLVGGLINTLGILLIIIGIVLHIVATSRRKRVDRELPPPRPYRGP